jgi:hypothetical protein
MRKLIAMLNRCSYIVNADPTAEKIALLTQLLNQVCEHLLLDRSSGLTFMRPAVNEINLNASIERLRGSSGAYRCYHGFDEITEIKVHNNNDPTLRYWGR